MGANKEGEVGRYTYHESTILTGDRTIFDTKTGIGYGQTFNPQSKSKDSYDRYNWSTTSYEQMKNNYHYVIKNKKIVLKHFFLKLTPKIPL